MLAILKTQKPLFLMKPTITSNSHLKHYVVCHKTEQIFLLTQILLRSVVMAVIICKFF